MVNEKCVSCSKKVNFASVTKITDQVELGHTTPPLAYQATTPPTALDPCHQTGTNIRGGEDHLKFSRVLIYPT